MATFIRESSPFNEYSCESLILDYSKNWLHKLEYYFPRARTQRLGGGQQGDCQMAVNHVNEDLLNSVLCDLRRFVKRLGLPVHLHHLYDDIIQDTMILVHRKWVTLTGLDPAQRTGWVCNAMFNVARNSTRAQLRQTQAWERLTNTAFENAQVKEYFDRPQDDHADVLTIALNALSVLDRKLLIDHVWAGHSITELATTNNLTETAIRHRLTRARQTARQHWHPQKKLERLPQKTARNTIERTFTK